MKLKWVAISNSVAHTEPVGVCTVGARFVEVGDYSPTIDKAAPGNSCDFFEVVASLSC